MATNNKIPWNNFNRGNSTAFKYDANNIYNKDGAILFAKDTNELFINVGNVDDTNKTNRHQVNALYASAIINPDNRTQFFNYQDIQNIKDDIKEIGSGSLNNKMDKINPTGSGLLKLTPLYKYTIVGIYNVSDSSTTEDIEIKEPFFTSDRTIHNKLTYKFGNEEESPCIFYDDEQIAKFNSDKSDWVFNSKNDKTIYFYNKQDEKLLEFCEEEEISKTGATIIGTGLKFPDSVIPECNIIGKYNSTQAKKPEDANNFNLQNALFIIGNGTSTERKNALTVFSDDRVYIDGNLYVNSDSTELADPNNQVATVGELNKLETKLTDKITSSGGIIIQASPPLIEDSTRNKLWINTSQGNGVINYVGTKDSKEAWVQVSAVFT